MTDAAYEYIPVGSSAASFFQCDFSLNIITASGGWHTRIIRDENNVQEKTWVSLFFKIDIIIRFVVCFPTVR